MNAAEQASSRPTAYRTWPVAATVSWVRDRGGVAVVPHPFQRSRHGVRKRDVPDADGIEIFNAWSMTGIQNRRARLFASRKGYPRFGGSDAHDPGMVGYAYTELPGYRVSEEPLRTADVLAGLRGGETAARGTTASVVECLGRVTRSVGLKTRTTVERSVFGAD